MTARDDLGAVSAELEKKFGEAKSVNLIWKAQNLIDDPEQAQKVVRMIDALEDCDDVTNVYRGGCGRACSQGVCAKAR